MAPASQGQVELVRDPLQIGGGQIRLWIGDDVPVMGLGPGGSLLGMLFSRETMKRCAPPACFDPCANIADRLLREYWGAYLAFWPDRTGRRLHVITDPSGLLPAYSSRMGDHLLVASHAELFGQAAGASLRVCPDALAAFLLRPELRGTRTCLAGVEEIAPGTLLSIGDGQVERNTLWRPSDVTAACSSLTFREAAADLRSLGTAVLDAWAGAFGPVAVAASGGVDSSFICGALQVGGADYSCVTLATPDASGDERIHVRQLASHLGVPYLECRYDPSGFDIRLPASAGLTRPSRKSFLASLDNHLRQAMAQLAAGVVMDGNGGDNLFCYLHSAVPIVDRLLAEGPGRGSLASFIDMCRVTGCDIPAMSAALVRSLRKPRAGFVWPPDRRLLSPGACLDCAPQPFAAWAEAVETGSRGRAAHCELLMHAQFHVHGPSEGWPRLSPLLSQPLVEYCLSLPSWLWCEGGLNRALARDAFARELPPSIVARTSKAGPDSFLRGIYAVNRQAIRDLLLGGWLASRGLLDPVAVEQALHTDPLTGSEIIYRLLDLAEAENWARSWDG
ncbi:MAG: hypothetical protein IE921_15295 [Rhodobacteraceae bacterium]|nr:hypothetical protein [Paracoccaceae bacterium]